MLDTPVDAWYAWVGVAFTSLVVLGVVTSLPSAPPPDAASAARTIDTVAAASYPSTATQPLDATDVKLGPSSVSLRRNGVVRTAALRYGPVTPASTGRLRRIARGVPPGQVFETSTAFERAVVNARERPTEWRTAANEMTIRRLDWEGIDVTLVAV